MKKNTPILMFLMVLSMLFLPLGRHTVSANMSSTETTREFEYVINYVKPGGNGDCLSWATACDLQTALSNIPDQIWVASGVYKPTTTGEREASFELESGVKIFGGFPADGGAWETRDWENNPTILSGDIGIEGDASDNSYHVVSADGVNHLAVLDGFTITGGNADMPDNAPNRSGGGMFNQNSSPELTNLKFIDNSARYGSGMYNNQSSPELTNATFTANIPSVGGIGAGMYNVNQSSPILTDVTFSENGTSYEGGGAMVNETQSSPTLTNVSFIDNLGGGMVNIADSNPTLTHVIFSGNESMIGGGMKNESSSPTLTDVTFSGNSGSRGGGMYNNVSHPILTNVTFSGNTANDHPDPAFEGIGGGMVNWYGSDPTLTNVTFSGNTASGYGGGLYNADSCEPQLTNVTFWGNTADISGGGLAFFSASGSATITNAILWGNTPEQIYNDTGSSLTVTFSAIQGVDVYPGEGNIHDDPLLGELADNGGYTMTHALLEDSPAVDAGDPANCPDTDQRGVVRPQGDFCDMGAYEYEFSADLMDIFLPLILR
jgi:predicted outer membrane repeat protein